MASPNASPSSGRANLLRRGAIVTSLGLGVLLVTLAITQERVPAQTGTFEFVFASGLDRGKAGDMTTFALTHRESGSGTARLEWQTSVKRTGDGAYRLVGGTITNEKTLVGGLNSKTSIFGGLEVWVGGAFSFASFPNPGLSATGLMVAVPSDGVQGANDKPMAAVTAGGKLLLVSSQATVSAESATTLALNKWYYIVLHGRNGTDQTQQLFLYDGDTGELLEVLEAVWTVNGDHLCKCVKWGFTGRGQHRIGRVCR